MTGAEGIQYHWVDKAFVLFYLIIIWIIAVSGRKTASSGESYLLAGRKLTVPAFVATIVTTWYGGILGVGEHAWQYGLNTWLVFGAPYYIHAIVFALVFAPRARKARYTNLPDQLEQYYGRRTAILGAGLLSIVLLPAPYILMTGILIRMILPVSLPVALSLGGLLSILYVWKTGMNAVVRTDKLQFLLMFSGFFLVLLLCMTRISPFELPSHIPENHLTWHGGKTGSYIGLWLILAAQTYIEPSFHQRCYAAKSEKAARTGMLLSVFAWLVFDAMTVMTGIYTRALVPNLDNAVMAYPALGAAILPTGLNGLFLVALFATVMSTVDSYAFLSAITIGRDFIGRLKLGVLDDSVYKYTRPALLAVAVVSIILSWLYQSVVTLWIILGSISVPALLIPVTTSFWPSTRMKPKLAFVSILSASLSVAGWTFFQQVIASVGNLSGNHLLEIEPIYIGLLVSIFVYIIDRSLLVWHRNKGKQ